jgi:hypothetical protein
MVKLIGRRRQRRWRVGNVGLVCRGGS